MSKTLRCEALSLLRQKALPYFMEVEDLIHAGWLGYQEGLQRADPSRGDPHQYAKQWARGSMRAEVVQWFGGRRRDGGVMIAWGIRHHRVDPAPDAFEIQEREEYDHGMEQIVADMLAHLPLRQRQAIFFRYVHSLTRREIAAELSITPALAEKEIKEGLNTLRKLVAA